MKEQEMKEMIVDITSLPEKEILAFIATAMVQLNQTLNLLRKELNNGRD